MSRSNFLSGIILVALIGATFFTRLHGLSDHFAHIDDIGVAYSILETQRINSPKDFSARADNFSQRIFKPEEPGFESKAYALARFFFHLGILKPFYWLAFSTDSLFIVSKNWTYAPFQFLFTPLAINPEQSYEDLKFWGRLPSAIFSILALILYLFFVKKWWGANWHWPAILGSVLLCFSWENIIYAQQMESYAIGVFASTALMVIIAVLAKRMVLTKITTVWVFATLGCLFTMQYQMLFLAFALSLAIGIYFYFYRYQPFLSLTKRFVLGGLIFSIFFIPVYWFYLKQFSALDIYGTWYSADCRFSECSSAADRLANGRFAFDISQSKSVIGKLFYPILFFSQNLYLAFKSNLLFTYSENILAQVLMPLLFMMFILGLWSIARSKKIESGLMKTFFSCVGIVWGALIVGGKITLGPTRHALVLTPFMLFAITQGLEFAVNAMNKKYPLHNLYSKTVSALVVLIVLAFGFSYSSIRKERSDHFDEVALRNLLEERNVDLVVEEAHTLQLTLMPGLNRKIPVLTPNFMKWSVPRERYDANRIAIIGHRRHLDEERLQWSLDDFKHFENSNIKGTTLKDYRIVETIEHFDPVEIEFTNYTKNGLNGFFMVLLEKINPSSNLK